MCEISQNGKRLGFLFLGLLVLVEIARFLRVKYYEVQSWYTKENNWLAINVRRIKKFLVWHGRKISLEVVNFSFNYDCFFKMIGKINKRLKIIKFVFLVYPETIDYALKFVYLIRLPKVRWIPWICGIMIQNGKIGLMFCVSNDAQDFDNPENVGHIEKVKERMEEIGSFLYVDQVTYAGGLPGIMKKREIKRDPVESTLAAKGVKASINLVKAIEKLPETTKQIVLGGDGFVGQKLVALLDSEFTYSIDKKNGQDHNDLPDSDGERVLIVNITLKGEIKKYVDVLPHGSVIINEVYPPPDPKKDADFYKALKEKDIKFYHIAGVKAFAFPAFPGPYAGSIPLCAAWDSEDKEIVIKQITEEGVARMRNPSVFFVFSLIF